MVTNGLFRLVNNAWGGSNHFCWQINDSERILIIQIKSKWWLSQGRCTVIYCILSLCTWPVKLQSDRSLLEGFSKQSNGTNTVWRTHYQLKFVLCIFLANSHVCQRLEVACTRMLTELDGHIIGLLAVWQLWALLGVEDGWRMTAPLGALQWRETGCVLCARDSVLHMSLWQ